MAKAKKQEAKPIVSYKGFDPDFKCRDFQFEIGKTYKVEGKIKACENGFHACENPFDVWSYYPLADYGSVNRFALVEQSGEIDRVDGGDTKIASASITIKAELSLPEFIKRGVDYLLSKVDFDNAKETNTGYRSAATNTGDRSAATNTGYQSAATVEGKESVAMACGYEGRVSGSEGCALFLVERNDEYKIITAWAGIAGKDGIKPNTFYMLKGGKPVEVG